MNAKPLPRAAIRLQRLRKERTDDRATKHEIRMYHGFKCCVCGKKGRIEVHEEKRRGAGGEVNLQNSYLACVLPTGACHDLLQTRHILCERADGLEPFDAREPLRFVMSQRIADLVFPHGRIPATVHIVQEGV